MREAKWRKVSEYLSGSSSLILPRICEKKVGILTSFVPSEEEKKPLSNAGMCPNQAAITI